MSSDNGYRVYLAGELFDAKHLAGNVLLAEAIEAESNGRFRVVLPQDLELPSMEPKTIRDEDFKALLDCDAAIFQFDGCDLDSGTVAEFMAAKFADIPSVLLRTDFRRGGDRNEQPWNLMCSFYPRTKSLVVDAMGAYAEARNRGVEGGRGCVDSAMADVARGVVERLDACMALPKLDGLKDDEWMKWVKASLGI